MPLVCEGVARSLRAVQVDSFAFAFILLAVNPRIWTRMHVDVQVKFEATKLKNQVPDPRSAIPATGV